MVTPSDNTPPLYTPLWQLRENLFNPTAIHTILSDDIYFFQGKRLLANWAYGRVPDE